MVDLAPYVEAQARRYIRAYARWLCGGYIGRGKLDSVYVGTTERRDGPGPEQWKKYSSCGDLSQELVWQMGVRKPFVNRAAYQGWRSGKMLSDFYARDTSRADHRPPAVTPEPDFVPGAGDIGFIWDDAGEHVHTCIFGDLTGFAPDLPLTALNTGVMTKIETFNYGAGGMSPTEFPGSKMADSLLQYRHREPLLGAAGKPIAGKFKLTLHPNGTKPIEGATIEPGIWIGTRKLRYVLTVPTLIALVETDALPTMTTEMIAGLEGRVKE